MRNLRKYIDKYSALVLPDNLEWTVVHIDEIAFLKPILFSEDAIEAYKTGKVSATDLKDLSDLQILRKIAKAILSSAPLNQNTSSIDMIDDISKINLLISWDAQAAYKTGKVSFVDLKDLPESKIALLSSYRALAAYKTGMVSITDLKDLPESKIEVLFSDNARAAYKTGKVSFADLKDFSESSIELLTQYSAIEKLEAGSSFVDILKEYKKDLSHADQVIADRIIQQKEQAPQR